MNKINGMNQEREIILGLNILINLAITLNNEFVLKILGPCSSTGRARDC